MEKIYVFVFQILIEGFLGPIAWFLGAVILKALSFGRANVGRYRYSSIDRAGKELRGLWKDSELPFEELKKLIRASDRAMWVGLAVLVSPPLLLILLGCYALSNV